ncbi:peptidase M61 [Sulfobacillus sp. hq2]|nr:peptidase M61 [Sulfobacillus sp. hq2]
MHAGDIKGGYFVIPTFSFTVSFLEPGLHVYHLTLKIDQLPKGRHTLSLPVWTPGSYEVEDYARHLFDLTVKANQQDVGVHHASKNTWEFELFEDQAVEVRYKVYAFELGVATSHLDQSHAYWNGAQLFLLVDDYKAAPYYVSLEAPPSWQASTGLDRADDVWGQYRAADYDVLIDSPFEVGTHTVCTFEVDDKPHTIAVWGHGNEDLDKLTQDVKRIVIAQRDLFGSLPYEHYTFILHLMDKSTGGLEHLNSTTCGVERFAFRPWKNYRRVLGLISHEFFHLWNVKRIHPDMLGPFDYNKEVYTHLLWAMEGFTDYYAYLTLRRSGLYSVKDYLDGLGRKIAAYEKQPGRFVQSLTESSFDTWIKLYKPDEDSVNRTLSYYLGGDLLGTCLDLEIRQRTDNQASLDDVLRRLYDRYGAHGIGFPESVYQETVEEVAQSSFEDFFARHIHKPNPLPLEDALLTAGLKIERSYTPGDDAEESHESNNTQSPRPWLGIETKIVDGHQLVVKSVYAPGPSQTLLNAGDHIIGLNGYRIASADDLKHRIQYDHHVGDTVVVNFFRRGQLQSVSLVLGTQPFDKVQLVPVKEPSPRQTAIFESWMVATWDSGLSSSDRPL